MSDARTRITTGIEERIAREFHREYERLAPFYNYQTRPASSVPWKSVPHENKSLMIQTVAALIDRGVIQAPSAGPSVGSIEAAARAMYGEDWREGCGMFALAKDGMIERRLAKARAVLVAASRAGDPPDDGFIDPGVEGAP